MRNGRERQRESIDEEKEKLAKRKYEMGKKRREKERKNFFFCCENSQPTPDSKSPNAA